MKTIVKLLLVVTLLCSAALVLVIISSFMPGEAGQGKVYQLDNIAMCGTSFEQVVAKHRAHADCHAPVTSYVDLLPPPSLMSGVGNSQLVITTKVDSAQLYFNQGLSMLHNFWDFEAYRAFKHAARLDSTAAMPNWGIAMALNFNAKREQEYKNAISRAKILSKQASDKEQLYIAALVKYDSLGDEKGYQAFKDEMQKLIYRYPDDVEAKLILWLNGLDARYDAGGNPNNDALYAQLMLEKLLQTHPDHAGVHHYWIHQMENCCPEQALQSADKLASMAPQSGHMVHMPGHIYYRLGDYPKARASFLASMKVDSGYMATQKVEQLDNWNYMHNLHYMMANCTEEGRYQEAVLWHAQLENIPATADSLTDRLKDYRASVFRRIVMYGADLDLRFGNWAKVADRFSRLNDQDSIFSKIAFGRTYKNVLIHFAKGMDAIEKKKPDQATHHANALDALLWRFTKQENADLPRFFENRSNILSLELRGNLLASTGELEKGIELLKQAQQLEKKLGYKEPPYYARPVGESIARAQIMAKEYDAARKTYEVMLKARPNSGFALYGIAQTYELQGDKQLAKQYYTAFRKAWRTADKDLAMVKKADLWLKKNN